MAKRKSKPTEKKEITEETIVEQTSRGIPEEPTFVPDAIADFSVIKPGWYRVSNTTVSQLRDANDPRGFRDKLLAEQKKSTYDYLVKYPRFAARNRNLWPIVKMSKEYREHLLTLKNRDCLELDKKDLEQRLTYMEKELGIAVSEFR